MAGKGILAFALNAQEIPPEVGVADGVLAERIALLCLFQHDIKRFLNAGKRHFALAELGQLARTQADKNAQRTPLLY